MAASSLRNSSRLSAGLRVRLPVSLSIGEPLAGCATDPQPGPLDVIEAELDAMRIAEIKLGQIAVQVRGRDMMVGADHAALEDREIALNRVGVGVAAYILLDRVIDGV